MPWMSLSTSSGDQKHCGQHMSVKANTFPATSTLSSARSSHWQICVLKSQSYLIPTNRHKAYDHSMWWQIRQATVRITVNPFHFPSEHWVRQPYGYVNKKLLKVLVIILALWISGIYTVGFLIWILKRVSFTDNIMTQTTSKALWGPYYLESMVPYSLENPCDWQLHWTLPYLMIHLQW